MVAQSKSVVIIAMVSILVAAFGFQYTKSQGQNPNPPTGDYRKHIQYKTTLQNSAHVQEQPEKQQQKVIKMKSK